MIKEMNICEYLAVRSEDDILVDMRDKVTYGFGTIEGAVNIPIEDIAKLYSLPREKNIYVFCQAGELSEEFTQLLSDAGYNAVNLTGGYRYYLKHKLQS